MADDDSTTQDTAPDEGAVRTEEQPEAETVETPAPGESESQVRKANKEAERLRLKLKEYEDRDKTELQRAMERAEEAERRAAASETQRVRSDIARELGVPPRFVVGESEDDMREAAKEYLDDRKAAQDERVRRSEVDQGPRGDAKPSQLGRADLASMSPSEIEDARAAGRLTNLMSGK